MAAARANERKEKEILYTLKGLGFFFSPLAFAFSTLPPNSYYADKKKKTFPFSLCVGCVLLRRLERRRTVVARPRVLIDPQQRLASRDTRDNNDVMNDILSITSLLYHLEKKRSWLNFSCCFCFARVFVVVFDVIHSLAVVGESLFKKKEETE